MGLPAAPLSDWRLWALGAAVFAAVTALLAKVGVEGVNSNFATFVRTLVIVPTLLMVLLATRQFQHPGSVTPKTYLFLALSGLATGASWLCYFRALQLGPAARVAPIDKLSVVLVAVAGTLFLGERLSLGAWVGVGLIATGAICVAVL
jgi:transporter family protein